MISKINKSIIRDIFSFINYKKVLILSKGNKKLCEINKITIKTLEIVNEVIQYYKKVNKDGIQTYNISPFKIDSDNDSIMNDFFEEIENKYEGESNENIQKRIKNGLIPEVPNLEEIQLNNKKKKERITQNLKNEYGKNETEIRNIIFLTQLSLLKIENYIPLQSHIIYNSESNELIKSILIPNKHSHIVILGNSKGEIILVNTNYIKNKVLLQLNTFKIKIHKNHITKIIQIQCLSKENENKITIASSSLDKTIKLFSLSLDNDLSEKSLSLLTILKCPKPVHTICEINNYSLASGTNEIIIWNLLDFRKNYSLEKHYGTVYSIYSIDEGNNILIGSAQMKILSTKFNQLRGMIYNNIDVPTYGLKEVFAIRDICKIKNGNIVICEDSHLTIYDLYNKDNEKRTILNIDNSILNKIIDIGNNQVLTCGKDGNIVIIDIEKKIIISFINSIESNLQILDAFFDDVNGDLYYCGNGKCIKIDSFNSESYKNSPVVDWEDYAYYNENNDNVFKRAFRLNINFPIKYNFEEKISRFSEEKIFNI